MNFVLVALILDLLCSTVVSAAKNDDPLVLKTDDDYFLRLKAVENKCFSQLFDCESYLRKYQQPYIQGEHPDSSIPRNVYNAGARVVCGDIRSMMECYSETIRTYPDSLRIPRIMERFSVDDTKLFLAVNSMCIQHLSAIEQHWDCLINMDRINDLIYCGRQNFSAPCDFKPQIECSVKVIESSPSCGAGSGQFIQEFQKKFLPARFGCPAFEED